MHDEGGHAASPVPDGARTVAVRARSFSFVPAEITVRSGEAIAIELSSEDAEHDFVIDGLDAAHVSADTGETATGGFRAHAPGRVTFYCSVPGHREAGMTGTLVVEAHQ